MRRSFFAPVQSHLFSQALLKAGDRLLGYSRALLRIVETLWPAFQTGFRVGLWSLGREPLMRHVSRLTCGAL